jgi:hypothetical protein
LAGNELVERYRWNFVIEDNWPHRSNHVGGRVHI